jgi:hypothetical protein
MAVWETLVATTGGAVSVTVGVVVGAVLTRRAQDRHWLRRVPRSFRTVDLIRQPGIVM